MATPTGPRLIALAVPGRYPPSRRGAPDDVHDAVRGADRVEVHDLDGRAMHTGLSFD